MSSTDGACDRNDGRKQRSSPQRERSTSHTRLDGRAPRSVPEGPPSFVIGPIIGP